MQQEKLLNLLFNMKKRKNFTHDSVIKEALKYKTKSEFAKNDKPAYNYAQRNGLINRICSHMDTEYWKWTNEELEEEALKYSTKKRFYEK